LEKDSQNLKHILSTIGSFDKQRERERETFFFSMKFVSYQQRVTVHQSFEFWHFRLWVCDCCEAYNELHPIDHVNGMNRSLQHLLKLKNFSSLLVCLKCLIGRRERESVCVCVCVCVCMRVWEKKSWILTWRNWFTEFVNLPSVEWILNDRIERNPQSLRESCRCFIVNLYININYSDRKRAFNYESEREDRKGKEKEREREK
jgi:hypothetical protein